MNRLIGLILTLSLALASVPSVSRAVTSQLTESQIETIRTNCNYTQKSLMRIQASDALARVNLGREYETIFTRMMTPMNSRVVLNSMDATGLVGTATSFSNQLNHFRTLYQQYDQLMDQAKGINCNNQPVQFYDTVNSARDKRIEVAQSVTTLNRLLDDYRSGIDGLNKQLSKDGSN